MLITTLGFSRMIARLGIEIKKTWYGRRYAIVRTVVQQERKGLRWVDVASEKVTLVPMFPFTKEGLAQCKKHLQRLRELEEESENAS